MKKKYSILLILIICAASCKLYAQKKVITDSVKPVYLDSVKVNAYLHSDAKYLTNVVGTNIFAGKKTNLVLVDAADMSLAQNITRTIYAKIPGITMWDMDGAGLQVNIGSRGTDSHRSIEMNMRQNGYNTNSDIFGYPENHYTVPMQGVQEIQLVRGSAALLFGSQFGGMMNYVMKEGDSTRPFVLESEQTTGSNNFFNSYNAVGGTTGNLNYYAYYDYRSGKGWRPNAAFNYHAYYASLQYRFSKKSSIALQFSRMDYVQQIAGGLNDAQFTANNKQSVRARNFFQPVINIPAAIFKYSPSANTQIEITAHALFGQRNSVQFINPPNIADSFNTNIGSYNPRQVDRDYYDAFTTEARLLHRYRLGTLNNVLTTGVRLFTELTRRKQKGVGTTGSNFDLSLIKPYGIDLRFTTNNYAVFAENMINITPQFSVTPGFRYEIININMKGVINNASVPVAYKGNRKFPLFGLGLQYQVNKFSQLYANISQAYRPYLYSTITPSDRFDIIDPNLKDSKGYDIDFGYRGQYKDVFHFDVNAFYLFYGNRVGLITTKDNNNVSHLFTTNIGDAVTKGIEAYTELSLMKIFNEKEKINDIRFFNSFAYNHAVYTTALFNKAGTNTSIAGNYVENVPKIMNKAGITFQHKTMSATIQYSYTGKSYNDALNTARSADGITGLIPAYHVYDVVFYWQFKKAYHLSAGINNFTDEKYFSRRITFYPGPAILPADGRTFYISLGIKI